MCFFSRFSNVTRGHRGPRIGCSVISSCDVNGNDDLHHLHWLGAEGTDSCDIGADILCNRLRVRIWIPPNSEQSPAISSYLALKGSEWSGKEALWAYCQETRWGAEDPPCVSPEGSWDRPQRPRQPGGEKSGRRCIKVYLKETKSCDLSLAVNKQSRHASQAKVAFADRPP